MITIAMKAMSAAAAATWWTRPSWGRSRCFSWPTPPWPCSYLTPRVTAQPTQNDRNSGVGVLDARLKAVLDTLKVFICLLVVFSDWPKNLMTIVNSMNNEPSILRYYDLNMWNLSLGLFGLCWARLIGRDTDTLSARWCKCKWRQNQNKCSRWIILLKCEQPRTQCAFKARPAGCGLTTGHSPPSSLSVKTLGRSWPQRFVWCWAWALEWACRRCASGSRRASRWPWSAGRRASSKTLPAKTRVRVKLLLFLNCKALLLGDSVHVLSIY